MFTFWNEITYKQLPPVFAGAIDGRIKEGATLDGDNALSTGVVWEKSLKRLARGKSEVFEDGGKFWKDVLMDYKVFDVAENVLS